MKTYKVYITTSKHSASKELIDRLSILVRMNLLCTLPQHLATLLELQIVTPKNFSKNQQRGDCVLNVMRPEREGAKMQLGTKIKKVVELLEEIEKEGALIILNSDLPELSRMMKVDELYRGCLYGGDYLEIHISKL